MKNTLRQIMILLLALPLPAFASCALCTCTASATGVSFGKYNPPSGSEDTGYVRISCGGAVGTVAYTIQLNRGMYSPSFSPRRLGSGRNRLNYNLYTSPAHTTIWGDGSSGTGFISNSLSILPGGSSRNHIVYGQIPSRQTSSGVGNYSDTITFTIIYQ